MSRVFLDTNVPVYAADNRDPAKQRLAHRLLTDLHHEHRGVLSTQVLQEFFVVATGKLGISPEKARQLVGMLADFEVVAVGVP